MKMKRLQHKLIWMLLLTSTLPLILVAGITISFLGKLAVQEAFSRINNNLKITANVYSSVNEQLKYAVRDQNRRIATLLEDNQLDLMRNEYNKVIQRYKLDFFVVTDAAGKVLVSMTNPKLEGYDYSRNIFVRMAMQGKITVSTEVFNKHTLERLGLLSKSRIESVEPVQGMVITTSMPVINPNEVVIGTMTAGYLLNNNNAVLGDKITQDTGLAASIFLDNLRICSNIPFNDKFRVIGSLLPEQFAGKTLLGGKNFISRIPVGDSWYLSGYLPIEDSEKKIIGMIGISISEKEIFKLRDNLMKVLTAAVLLSIFLSLVFGGIKGANIVRSIRKLRKGIEAFGHGDFYHRVEIKSGDEIEELAIFFNNTMEQLRMTKNELEVCSRNILSLEHQVTKTDQQLAAVHKQLLEYERMAAMGKMATSLSHELRNVFTEIQSSAYSLKERIDRNCPGYPDFLKGIEEGLNRANEILTSILNFSYPKKLILSEVDINYLIDSMLSTPNLEAQVKNNRVNVVKDLAQHLPGYKADGVQMREAVLNLVVNAIQAMPEGGTLKISTREDQGMLRIRIADTGSGMTEETLSNIFTPFFTTKSRGLGLGLAISKSIIQEHGGHIQAESELGKGTVFSISLPRERKS